MYLLFIYFNEYSNSSTKPSSKFNTRILYYRYNMLKVISCKTQLIPNFSLVISFLKLNLFSNSSCFFQNVLLGNILNHIMKTFYTRILWAIYFDWSFSVLALLYRLYIFYKQVLLRTKRLKLFCLQLVINQRLR